MIPVFDIPTVIHSGDVSIVSMVVTVFVAGS